MPLTDCHNDKSDHDFCRTLSTITTIPITTLQRFRPGTDTVRETMCWVAKRQTTRIEDMAYSLIGLFDVSLTIQYGERERAFYRLQLAIMDTAPALDLLLWQSDTDRIVAGNTAFASSPAYFLYPTPHSPDVPADQNEHYQYMRYAIDHSIATPGRELRYDPRRSAC